MPLDFSTKLISTEKPTFRTRLVGRIRLGQARTERIWSVWLPGPHEKDGPHEPQSTRQPCPLRMIESAVFSEPDSSDAGEGNTTTRSYRQGDGGSDGASPKKRRDEFESPPADSVALYIEGDRRGKTPATISPLSSFPPTQIHFDDEVSGASTPATG